MVLTPSAARFEELVAWNKEHGTAEGGDQCLLNEYFSGMVSEATHCLMRTHRVRTPVRAHACAAAAPRGAVRTDAQGLTTCIGFTMRGTTTTAAGCRG